MTGGVLTWALISAYQRLYEPVAGDDLRAWQHFAAISGGLGGAVVGLVVGGVIGLRR